MTSNRQPPAIELRTLIHTREDVFVDRYTIATDLIAAVMPGEPGTVTEGLAVVTERSGSQHLTINTYDSVAAILRGEQGTGVPTYRSDREEPLLAQAREAREQAKRIAAEREAEQASDADVMSLIEGGDDLDDFDDSYIPED